MITCTVGGVSYPIANDQLGAMAFSIEDRLENRSILTITLLDTAGTANFTRGQQVVLSDSIQGVLYSGFVQSSSPRKFGLSVSEIGHTLTCMDKQYLVDKRTNSKNYLNYYAGDVVADFVQGTLGTEGITAPIVVGRDSTAADFNQGTLSNTVGATSTTADGDLELAKAGADLTITETSTADFSTGTLTNVTASSNSLTPTSTQALSLQATLGSGTATGAYMAVAFWEGSMTVGTSDTLYYDIWIGGGSPEIKGCVDLYFSDGSILSTDTLSDQNLLSTARTTDLSNYAKNAWYTRQIALTGLNGFTINAVTITAGGTSGGTYNIYVKNVYLGSQTGNKFLAPTTTITNVNPPAIYRYLAYNSSVTCKIVSVFLANNASRLSPAHSIDAVKLVKSSLVSWNGVLANDITVSVSYDGGVTYTPCTNNAALPALPSGSNVTGGSLIINETFNAASSNTDPTVFPVLNDLTISLYSAPNATKSDSVTTYATSTQWNTGTYSNTVLSGNNLTLGTYTRNWNDNLITNQTFFTSTGATQAASSGTYRITTPSPSSVSAASRLDFAGQMQDFTLDCDVRVDQSVLQAGAYLTSDCHVLYRNNSWDTFDGYRVYIRPQYYSSTSGLLQLTGPSGDIAYAIRNITITTTYHLKIVVNGSRHQVYFNNETSPSIDVIDTAYVGIGGFGFYQFNKANYTFTNLTVTCEWDNFVLNPIETGTWTSPSISLNSLSSCGGSSIFWTEQNTTTQALASIVVQTSIDGGSTYQQCTNGSAISGLSSGVSLVGKSLIIQAVLNSLTTPAPILSQLQARVLGAYPGSSGTRSTAPMGNDMSITRTVGSGWGTAFDGQTWTQTGTGTTAVGSNVETISNTTGDVHMRIGTWAWTDEDVTCRFKLSASTISTGLELRYVDSSNFYRLSANTGNITITKVKGGSATVITNLSTTLTTNTWYHMRFRVIGSGPIALKGNVWLADGLTLEPTINATTGLWNDSNWTITGSD